MSSSLKHNQYEFHSKVWQYPGMDGWHFISLPEDISDDIKKQFGDKKRGWGSLRVSAAVGKTSWDTSIFPDKKTNTYLLPLKAQVRKKENITLNDTIELLVEIKL